MSAAKFFAATRVLYRQQKADPLYLLLNPLPLNVSAEPERDNLLSPPSRKFLQRFFRNLTL